MFAGHRLQIQEIYHYLNNRNFNLSSQRILKQPQAHPQIVWNILVYLSMPLKDQKYDQIQPSLSYLLDKDLHKLSLKKMYEYIIVSSVSRKLELNNEYPLRQIFKPDKETLLAKLSALIQANRYHQMIQQRFQLSILEQKSLRQNIKEERARQQHTRQQIQQNKIKIESEKEQREQKKLSIENINKEINYKKKERLDLLNSQQELNNQVSAKKKQSSNCQYQGDNLNLSIKQLQRDLIQNAPKLKKQRIEFMEEYEACKNQIQKAIYIQEYISTVVSRQLSEILNTSKISESKFIENFKQVNNLSTAKIVQTKKQKSQAESNQQMTGKTTKELEQYLASLEHDYLQDLQSLNFKQEVKNFGKQKITVSKQQLKNLQTNVTKLEEKQKVSNQIEIKLNTKAKLKLGKIQKKIKDSIERRNRMEAEAKNIIKETFSVFEKY